MTSTVDIDKDTDKLTLLKEKHLLKCKWIMGDDKEYYVKINIPDNQVDSILALIREVAEEVITTKTKRAKSDYENGWNDCVDTCNENLNRILGEK